MPVVLCSRQGRLALISSLEDLSPCFTFICADGTSLIIILLLQDECSCIGCKQCVWLAPAVYRLESSYGRSRVFAQWANDEDDIQVS